MRVIEAIKKRINWEKAGVSEVFLCNNAEDAICLIKANDIQLIISDIEMPGTDGLTFVRRVKEYKSDIAVILLTAFSEFEYAREALLLGVNDYILKPVVYTELEDKIRHLIYEIERNISENRKESTKNFCDYIQLLIDADHEYSNTELDEICTNLHISVQDNASYIMIWLHIKASDEISWKKKKEYQQTVISQYELFSENTIYMELSGHQAVIIIPADEEHLLDIEAVRRTTIQIVEESSLQMNAYMSNQVSFGQLQNMIRKIKKKVQTNVLYQNYVFLIGNRHLETEKKVSWPDYEKWYALMVEGKFNLLKQLMDFNVQRLVTDGVMNLEILSNLYTKFMQCVYRFASSQFERYKYILENEEIVLSEHEAAGSLEAFRKFYYKILDIFMEETLSGSDDDIVDRVKKYIDQHIDEKISRKEIAVYLSYNESYLSRLFRKKTGIALSNYILVQKMIKAKKLLVQTNLSVGEISEKLGYDTSAYFIKLFKRETGMSPGEYRRELKL